MALLEVERLKNIKIEPDVHAQAKFNAIKHQMLLKNFTEEALTTLADIKDGKLIVTPATPQEDTRE